MLTEPKSHATRMLFLIALPKLTDKACDMLKEGGVPLQYCFQAQGTASSEIMDMLGLGSVDKRIMMTILPKASADEMLQKLKWHLRLGMPNTGVAFTIPVSNGNSRVMQLLETLRPESHDELLKRSEADMAECEYSMIMAIVKQGYSEDVMEAARPMGATGGSVIHSRRVGSEEAMRFWGIQIQPEQEILIILAKKADKLPIMQAIGKQCGMQTEARGIVFSMPVDSVVGLGE